MPFIQVNGTQIYYEEHGAGKETIVFSHGLLWSGNMFRAQVDYFKTHYRVITFDHRGQGQSPGKYPYDMDTLSEDAIALITQLVGGKVHFMGLSMGGFVGMRVAARRPDLVQSLVLLETSCEGEALLNIPKYGILNLVVGIFGIRPVIEPVKKIMFGKSFLNDLNRKEEMAFWEAQLLQNNPATITQAVLGVISRKAIVDELHLIKAPTLIITGEEDVATPIAKGKFISTKIKHSIFKTIPKAGHSSTIEEPASANDIISLFLRNI